MKKEENLVEAMMEQKRKREAPLPTSEDLLNEAIKNLKTLLPKTPKLIAKNNSESEATRGSRDKMLTEILSHAKASPEKDMDFIIHIPEMHLSWPAMQAICKAPTLLDIYITVITEIYKDADRHTKEQEHIWLAMDSELLIRRLSERGMEWSRSSERMIEQQYPSVYKRVYASTRPYSFFD